jgi:hypothetical protein
LKALKIAADTEDFFVDLLLEVSAQYPEEPLVELVA